MEEIVFKLAGALGVMGLVGQAANGIIRNYREKYLRPDSIVYRLDVHAAPEKHKPEAKAENASDSTG